MTRLERILFLDGGQTPALSILRELKEWMEAIERDSPGDETPQLCELFDKVGGTGNGHLVAIMLTQLRMVTDLL